LDEILAIKEKSGAFGVPKERARQNVRIGGFLAGPTPAWHLSER
jgi:hypothetical protein